MNLSISFIFNGKKIIPKKTFCQISSDRQTDRQIDQRAQLHGFRNLREPGIFIYLGLLDEYFYKRNDKPIYLHEMCKSQCGIPLSACKNRIDAFLTYKAQQLWFNEHTCQYTRRPKTNIVLQFNFINIWTMESSFHILCQCPEFEKLRLRYLGHRYNEAL